MLDNDKWYGTAILNVPIGESIAVTPMQMAALFGSVANGGNVAAAAHHGRGRRQADDRLEDRQLVTQQVARSCAAC